VETANKSREIELRPNVWSETTVSFGWSVLPLVLVSFRLWGQQLAA
jgi:hypothetical protein